MNISLLKRVVLSILGNVLIAIGIAIVNASNTGVDPYTSFMFGLTDFLNVPLGIFQISMNGFLILICYKVCRSKIGFGTFVNMSIIGFLIQYFSPIASSICMNFNIHYIIVMIVGILIIGLGVAFMFTTDLGIGGYDCVAYMLSNSIKKSYTVCRIFTDILCLTIAYILGATIGIGTVITGFLLGPLISFYSKFVIIPIFYREKLKDNIA